jgi:hypothetical protein
MRPTPPSDRAALACRSPGTVRGNRPGSTEFLVQRYQAARWLLRRTVLSDRCRRNSERQGLDRLDCQRAHVSTRWQRDLNTNNVDGGATTAAALTAGALTLNGFQVGASSIGASAGQTAASAFSKAAAINLVSSQSGVTATAMATSVTGAVQTGFSGLHGSQGASAVLPSKRPDQCRRNCGWCNSSRQGPTSRGDQRRSNQPGVTATVTPSTKVTLPLRWTDITFGHNTHGCCLVRLRLGPGTRCPADGWHQARPERTMLRYRNRSVGRHCGHCLHGYDRGHRHLAVQSISSSPSHAQAVPPTLLIGH